MHLNRDEEDKELWLRRVR